MTTTTTTTTTTPNRTAESAAPRSTMHSRQRPLMRLYKQEPAAAWIADGARTIDSDARKDDPVHGELLIGTSEPITVPLSLHSAVGGDHDGPNPGDFLSAALAGCLDSTIRVIANRLGVVLDELSVSVKAEVDVRGTLCVSADVPVGFQRMTLSVHAVPADGTRPEAMTMLYAAAEHCCVVLQTLRNGVQVDTILPDAPAQGESR